jgi:hypothetical protein
MSRITKLLTVSTAVLAPWFVTSPVVSQTNESLGIVTAITIPNRIINSFDISFVDPTIGLYVLADRTNKGVLMVDTHQNTFLGYCGQGQFRGATGHNDTSGPDGVLIRASREIWVGDGNSTVKVYDVAGCLGPHVGPKQVITTGDAALDKRADEMCYDSIDELVMVANNAADPPFATIIDASKFPYSIKKKIAFDGTNGFPKSTNGIEQCAWSPVTGKFYITVPGIETPDNGHGVVVRINTDGTFDTQFDLPVKQCATPQGMAMGPDGGGPFVPPNFPFDPPDDTPNMLIGCNGSGSDTKSSVIISQIDGDIIFTVANESGPDEVWFNPGDNHYYLARSAADGGVQMIGSIDAFNGTADPSVTVGPAGRNAHSIAADAVTNEVFFPVPASPHFPLCGQGGGDNLHGCILVLKNGKNDDDDANGCFASGTPSITTDVSGNPVILRSTCLVAAPIPPG